MEALKDFPEEYAKSFHISFIFMNNFNVRYLEDEQSILKKYWRYFYIIPAVLLLILGMGVYLFVMISEQQMIEVAYILPPFLVTVHTILKAIVLVPKTSEISAFIRALGGLWRTKFTERQVKEKNALLWKLNLCNKASYWVSILGTSQYLLSPLFETLVRRFILQQECELLLPIASSYPFNPTMNWLTYIFVYIFQFYTMFLLVFIYMGSELILITLSALLGAEFGMLKYDLSEVKPRMNKERKNIKTSDNDHVHTVTIEEFIKRHQELIRLSRQLDSVFNRMIFIDLLFVGITTCSFSFAGKFCRGPTYMLNNYAGVASSLLTVLYLCFYGEVLTTASSRIGDMAYQTPWYNGDIHYKKSIWLIIKISQRPCCLTSLRYAVVSLHMFTKVVSTTWSYFSLMNSVYSDK